MYFDYSKPIKSSRLYPLGKYLSNFLAPFVYDFTCYGQENIPLDGPVIIACNHISFTDPAVIIAFCPRKVCFMAKSELFETRRWSLLMNSMNAFPVKRDFADRNAIRYAAKVIDEGYALGIFPEGRTVSELIPADAKNGVAYIAHKNPKTDKSDYLHSIGCDEVMPQDESYNGHLVDALFEMVLWVNENHKEYLAEYKEKLQHFVKSV